ncbi:MAG: FKBP-type peptidyl-prolyl cis-trans isomerase [Phycisphaerales bacterium JB060]
MDNTNLSITPIRALAIIAVAGAAFTAGCGNSTQNGNDAGAPSSGQDRPTSEQAPPQTGDTPSADTQDATDQPSAPRDDQADEEPGLEGAPESQTEQSEAFTELGVTNIQVGDGDVAELADTVTVHYRGTFRESGEEFDSSYSRGEPLTLALNRFVPGFTQGVEGMRVGGKRRIEIPYRLAYGEQGSPPTIPPRSDLVFEVELMGVEKPEPPKTPDLATEFEGEPQDVGDGLVVRDIVVGQGEQSVKPGASVFVHILGVQAESGAQFASSREAGGPQQLDLSDPRMLQGLARGIVGMKPQGVRRIEVPAELGFGAQGAGQTVPPNTDLVFEIELLSMSNPRELSTEWVSEETRENGLIVRVVKEGDAQADPIPAEGIAEIHTMGVLEDGSVFDSTFTQGERATVPLEQAVIEGWKLGVVGMKPGEVRQFVVPPELGFGEEGQPPVVPPNATLTFEVELFDWRMPREFSTEFVGEPEELEEGITIRQVSVGEGPEASEGQMAVINYLAKLPDGTMIANTFDTGDMQVVPLDGQQPLPGLRKAIVGMKVGGVRRVELAAEQAFGAQGNPPMVPADTPITFEVELMGVQ